MLVVNSKENEGTVNPILSELLQSNEFFPLLLNGLKKSNVFFLKSRYLNTLVLSVYTISDMFQPRLLMERVQQMMDTLLSLLRNNEYNKEVRVESVDLETTVVVEQLRRVSNVEYMDSQYFKESQRKEWNQ